MGNIITVWGGNGSGKTAISCLLGKELSNKGYSACIVNVDVNTPITGVVMPLAKESDIVSVGTLINKTDLDTITVSKVMNFINDNLAVIGYKKGDNASLFGSFSLEQASRILDILKNQVDYVIVDNSSDFLSDNFLMCSLEKGNYKISIHTPELKSAVYMNSNYKFVDGDLFEKVPMIRILNKRDKGTNVEDFKMVYGEFDFYYPLATEVEAKCNTGKLFEKLTTSDGKKINSYLSDLANKIGAL